MLVSSHLFRLSTAGSRKLPGPLYCGALSVVALPASRVRKAILHPAADWRLADPQGGLAFSCAR
jgi:hypothetical protein